MNLGGRNKTMTRAAGTLLAIALLTSCGAAAGDETDAAAKDEPTSSPSPSETGADPTAPWTTTAQTLLSDEELNYTMVCIGWKFLPTLGPSSTWSGAAKAAAGTGNTGLMTAVDAANLDLAATGQPGALATAEMDRFCENIHIGK